MSSNRSVTVVSALACGRVYPSGVTDAQWKLVEPLLPCPGSGQRRRHSLRQVLNAILFVTKTGCPWRYVPKEYPCWSTVFWYSCRGTISGVIGQIHDRIRTMVRLLEDKRPHPTAAIIDSQTVKAADTVGKNSRGFDGAKKINGRKRHILVDTVGLLLVVLVGPANIHDTKAAKPLIGHAKRAFPAIRKIWADGGYREPLIEETKNKHEIDLDIVKRTQAHTFKVLPKRWIVERTLAWLMTHRRLTRDYEREPASSQAFCRLAMTRIMLNRLES